VDVGFGVAVCAAVNGVMVAVLELGCSACNGGVMVSGDEGRVDDVDAGAADDGAEREKADG